VTIACPSSYGVFLIQRFFKTFFNTSARAGRMVSAVHKRPCEPFQAGIEGCIIFIRVKDSGIAFLQKAIVSSIQTGGISISSTARQKVKGEYAQVAISDVRFSHNSLKDRLCRLSGFPIFEKHLAAAISASQGLTLFELSCSDTPSRAPLNSDLTGGDVVPHIIAARFEPARG
jgi:hypothetical protein